MRYGRQIAAIIFFFSICAGLLAQSFTLKTDGRIIGKNDALQVTYEISNATDISGFLPPQFEHWKIMAGPSSSQSIISVNGQTTRSFGYIYVLMPEKTGELALPGTTIIADGKKLNCKGITITVTNQSVAKPAPQVSSGLQSLFDAPDFEDLMPKDPVLKKNDDPAEIMRKNIFLRATTNKNTCYIGEPILVTYKLYTAIHTEARVTKQPAFTGCSVMELAPEESTPVMEHINGKDYRSYLIRRVILVPLQEGQLNLDATSVENEVSFAEAGNPYSIKKYSATIQSPPVSITVNALPAKNKPADFSGALGSFSISSALKNKEIAAGENNSLQVMISGTGNLQGIELPSIAWPDKVDHFDASKKEELSKTGFPASGNIIFDIPFIGLAEGEKTIPPIQWNYFDPATGSYKLTTTKPLTVVFTKAVKAHYAVTDAVSSENLSNKKYLWIVAGIALAAFIILFFTLRKGHPVAVSQPASVASAVTTDETVAPPVLAVKEKTDFQKSLEMLGQMNEDTLFYSTAKNLLCQSLKEFFEADLPLNALVIKLRELPNKSSLAEKCLEVNRVCEFSLYSGIHDDANRAFVQANLQEIIGSLQQNSVAKLSHS